LVLDDDHITLEGRTGDTILDCYVFAGDDTMISDVWTAGRHLVKNGKHIARKAIEQKYRETMRELGDII